MCDRERRFHEIDDQLNKMPKDEKRFTLWLLLREYNEDNAKEISEKSDTIEDYRKEKFYHDLCAECADIIDFLRFELWR